MDIGSYYKKRFTTYEPTKSEKKVKKPHPPKADVKQSLRAVMRGRGGRHGSQG